MKKIVLSLLLGVLSSTAAIAQFSNVPIEPTSTDTIGIYIFNPGQKPQQILPIKYYKAKINTLGTAFTYGIASTKMRNLYKGGTSPNIVTPQTRIRLYFGDVPIGLTSDYYMFAKQYSIRNFSVCEFLQKSNRRELETGSVNIWSGVSTGTDETSKLKFTVKTIREGVYECMIQERPASGEYCFLFSNNNVGAYTSVFDFTVRQKLPEEYQ